MTRRAAIFAVIVALLIGLAAGFVLRGISSGSKGLSLSVFQSDSSENGGNNGSNTALLTAAMDVLDALNSRDYSALSKLADPDEGVTFTPYSTVDFSTDVTLTAKELKNAESETTSYVWGVTPGDGEPMKMTISEYLLDFLWDADYTACPSFGVDTVLYTGNAQENVAEAYPGCRFVDCYLPGQGDDNLDWSALKLVFVWEDNGWYLRGIIHSQATA
ncbi:MAG: hypothetical protein LUD78_12440 [Clostridiales bacterium]|nr:hypothetical protein [Clostridiales bacterium]